MNLKTYLQTKISEAAKLADLTPDFILITSSKDEQHGDLSSSVALSLAKTAKKPPIEIAEKIIHYLDKNDEFIADIFVSPPGFINFKIHSSYYQSLVTEILKSGDSFGKTDIGVGKTANVEFVSANPTGPLTVGHGRQAVLGDTVANILEWHSFNVTREYYFNNAGRQMRLLAESVEARYRELIDGDVNFPEDGYQGNYIKEIASDILNELGKDLKNGEELFRKKAEEAIFNDIKSSLNQLGVIHDQFSNEKTFYETGAIDKTISELKGKELIYEADGATWFKTTSLGMDQDRVLIKSTGEPTYRLPDIAYHINKVERGFDFIIDIFGSDHVDTYPDVLAAVGALGYNTDHFKVLIHQFVTLLKKGQKVKMSTRKADFVTLKELIDDVGVDVVRYFFIMRSMNSHLNFDLDLAADQSDKNPVFYLQYAHARICNIIKHGESLGVNPHANFDASLLNHKAELELLKTTDQFTDIMEIAYKTLEPQGIANYLQDLATKFHKFYSECRVITDNHELTSARIALINAVKVILSNGLKVLGITTPERM
ncbi:MAG TPA: arginine--tRNA ligase [Candidatus Marinimicrobia bacterium]|nr:arginine--tRNA ligase [Candidatus Neomarinimicrobiota bacterium]